jgi:CheY-like chemotaxis protein
MRIGMEHVNTIALIDDDPVCHMISSKIIKLFSSFEVETFTKPAEALAQFKWRASNEPDKLPEYILLDIDMPGMNGWQFLEEFEKLPQNVLQRICVMMLSSSNHFTDIEKAKKYKTVKHFLSKPLTQEKLNLIKVTCQTG